MEQARLTRSPAKAPALTMTRAGDHDERNADRLAEEIVSPARGFDLSRVAVSPPPEKPASVAADVAAVLGATSGAPLAPATQQWFAERTGADFSHVRVHHDAGASALADRLDARAFTVGNHIYFGRSEFSPS